MRRDDKRENAFCHVSGSCLEFVVVVPILVGTAVMVSYDVGIKCWIVYF